MTPEQLESLRTAMRLIGVPVFGRAVNRIKSDYFFLFTGKMLPHDDGAPRMQVWWKLRRSSEWDTRVDHKGIAPWNYTFVLADQPVPIPAPTPEGNRIPSPNYNLTITRDGVVYPIVGHVRSAGLWSGDEEQLIIDQELNQVLTNHTF